MGEVFRARDTRLGREVAIKCLPPEVADDARRRERFSLEAQAIARLTHPNICTLYDMASEQGHLFLVMELVDGETLAARISRAPRGLDPDEALTIAAQLADALAFAHRQQIVHRDVKPSNILLTRSGVKLLDFGLAKLREPVEGDNETRSLLTGPHQVMGTLPYMAPEQLDGRSDTRTDIFACGAVIFEMLTGRRAFEGKSSTTIMAAIVSHDPLSSSADLDLPDDLRRLLRRCLSKDPEARWQSAADLADELRWIADACRRAVAARPSAAQAQRSTGASANRPRPAWRWAAVAVLTALAAGIVGYWLAPSAVAPDNSPAIPQRLTVSLPASAPFVSGLALSSDGQQLVYVSPGDSSRPARLYLRAMNAFDPRALEGTDGASDPFFSPDGQSIGFFVSGLLKRVSLVDGLVSTICRLPEGAGSQGAWGPDGTIVFSVPTSERAGLFRVPASGGTPDVLTRPDADDGSQWLAIIRAGTSRALIRHTFDSGRRAAVGDGSFVRDGPKHQSRGRGWPAILRALGAPRIRQGRLGARCSVRWVNADNHWTVGFHC